MIAALAEGGRVLKDGRYLEAARRAAGFIIDRMRRDDGRLLHTYKDNQAKLDAYLDDYADLIDGLTRLYEATGEPCWIESVLGLAATMIDEFADPVHGGFFFTGNRHEALIARPKDLHDNATPSGSGMAATALVRLGALTGREALTQAGRRALESVQGMLESQPAAGGQSLVALDFLLASIREIAVIAGSDPDEFRAVLEAIATPFRPHKVVAPATPAQAALQADKLPLLANRPVRDGKTTIYVCEHFACREPAVGVAGAEAAWTP